MKNGDVQVLLYLQTELQSKDRTELRAFLTDKVVTVEQMRRVAVRSSSLNRWDKQIEDTVLDAYNNHQPVVIYYRDAKGKRTTRMIEPREVKTDPYTDDRGLRRTAIFGMPIERF